MANIESELSVAVTGVDGAGRIPIMGAIVAWSPAGESSRTDVVEAFRSVGMAAYAPRERSLRDALHAGLVEQFSRKNRRVAPAGPKGYEVLVETPDPVAVRVETRHLVSAFVESTDTGEPCVRVDVEEFDNDGQTCTVADVAAWTMAAKARVDSSALGQSLSSVVQKLGGVALRDAGGAYWLPPNAVGTWLTLKSGLRGAVRTAEWEVAASPRTVESAVESIRALVVRRCEDIRSRMGGLGQRGLETLATEAAGLEEQLSGWETALSANLDGLRADIGEVQVAAVRAAQAAFAAREEKMRTAREAAKYAAP